MAETPIKVQRISGSYVIDSPPEITLAELSEIQTIISNEFQGNPVTSFQLWTGPDHDSPHIIGHSVTVENQYSGLLEIVNAHEDYMLTAGVLAKKLGIPELAERVYLSILAPNAHMFKKWRLRPDLNGSSERPTGTEFSFDHAYTVEGYARANNRNSPPNLLSPELSSQFSDLGFLVTPAEFVERDFFDYTSLDGETRQIPVGDRQYVFMNNTRQKPVIQGRAPFVDLTLPQEEFNEGAIRNSLVSLMGVLKPDDVALSNVQLSVAMPNHTLIAEPLQITAHRHNDDVNIRAFYLG